MEIHVLPWDMHRNVAGLNWLMESKPFPFNNWTFRDIVFTAYFKVYI